MLLSFVSQVTVQKQKLWERTYVAMTLSVVSNPTSLQQQRLLSQLTRATPEVCNRYEILRPAL
jgi:hypothetical protein